MFCPKWKTLKRHSADESGQSMVEFALVGTVFLLLVLGMFDLGFYFYSRVTLQNAVRQAARYAITGNCGVSGSCYGSGNGNTTPGDRVTTIMTTVVNYSFGLLSCTTSSGSYCTNSSAVQITCQGTCGNDYGDGGNNAGGPGDTVTITVTYHWSPWVLTRFMPSKFPGAVTYTVSSAFKNEQFPPAT
jgi:Flp pilus assembly protein TadG